MGGARTGREAVAGGRRAPPITAPPYWSWCHQHTDLHQREANIATTTYRPMPIAAARAAAIRRPRRSPTLTTGLAAPQTKDPGSTASRSPWVRAPSMRPTESVGVAAGEDEDEDGGVRSEGSGPQSWAIAPTVTAASGDLRRTSRRQDHRPTKNFVAPNSPTFEAHRQQESTNVGDKN